MFGSQLVIPGLWSPWKVPRARVAFAIAAPSSVEIRHPGQESLSRPGKQEFQSLPPQPVSAFGRDLLRLLPESSLAVLRSVYGSRHNPSSHPSTMLAGPICRGIQPRANESGSDTAVLRADTIDESGESLLQGYSQRATTQIVRASPSFRHLVLPIDRRFRRHRRGLIKPWNAG